MCLQSDFDFSLALVLLQEVRDFIAESFNGTLILLLYLSSYSVYVILSYKPFICVDDHVALVVLQLVCGPTINVSIGC